MILYLSGPMTGHEEFNRPAFHQAEKKLEALGYDVLSPARITEHDLNLDREPTWEDWMRHAIRLLMDADAVCKLPGWSQSRGALTENNLATDMGIEAWPINYWIRKRRTR